jgi:hypothetical protein
MIILRSAEYVHLGLRSRCRSPLAMRPVPRRFRPAPDYCGIFGGPARRIGQATQKRGGNSGRWSLIYDYCGLL